MAKRRSPSFSEILSSDEMGLLRGQIDSRESRITLGTVLAVERANTPLDVGETRSERQRTAEITAGIAEDLVAAQAMSDDEWRTRLEATPEMCFPALLQLRAESANEGQHA